MRTIFEIMGIIGIQFGNNNWTHLVNIGIIILIIQIFNVFLNIRIILQVIIKNNEIN